LPLNSIPSKRLFRKTKKRLKRIEEVQRALNDKVQAVFLVGESFIPYTANHGCSETSREIPKVDSFKRLSAIWCGGWDHHPTLPVKKRTKYAC